MKDGENLSTLSDPDAHPPVEHWRNARLFQRDWKENWADFRAVVSEAAAVAVATHCPSCASVRRVKVQQLRVDET